MVGVRDGDGLVLVAVGGHDEAAVVDEGRAGGDGRSDGTSIAERARGIHLVLFVSG
jgi:hypothetical protein